MTATTNHYTLIKEYLQRKNCVTKENIDNVLNTLSKYYFLVETTSLTKGEILSLKIEYTDLILSKLRIVSTFDNRTEFAKEFFIYESEKDIIDYLNWLENDYTEDNKEVVKNVHDDAVKQITEILKNLIIVDRNIGIGYTNDLIKAIDKLYFYSKDNYHWSN
jgi:hypothetical protein